MRSFFGPKEVAKLVNISYRQIQYWDKTGFICPSYRRRNKYRLYTRSDLVRLAFAKLLRENGYSIQGMREMLSNLAKLLPLLNSPLQEIEFFVEDKRILVFAGEVLATKPGSYIRFPVRGLWERINNTFPDPDDPEEIAA